MRHRITLAGQDERLWLAREGRGYRLDLQDGSFRISLTPAEGQRSTGRHGTSAGSAFVPGRYRLAVDGVSETIFLAVDGDDIYLHVDGTAHHLRYHDPIAALGEDAAATSDDVARAPMPGIVIAINVAPGQAVAAGDALLVIESMKLETTIRARHDGSVAVVHVTEGESFERDAVLVSFEREGT